MTQQNNNKKMRLLPFILAFLFVVGACSQKESPASKVPKNASGVVAVKTVKLGMKFFLDQLSLTGETHTSEEEDSKDSSSEDSTPDSDRKKWQKALADPTSLGLDITEDIYLYTTNEFMDNEPKMVVAILGLSDQESFEQFLDNDPPNDLNTPTQKGTNFSYRYNEIEGIAYGWNQNTLAIARTQPKSGNNPVDELKGIFSREKTESIMSNERFEEIIDKGSDVGVYIDVQQIMEQNHDKADPLLMKEQWAEHLNLFLSFDDGEIAISTTMYAKKGKENAMKEISEGVKLQEAFDLFKVDEALGFLNFRYDKESIKALIAQDERMLNQLKVMLVGMQMSEDEFYSLFDGNIMCALTGVEILEKEMKSFEMDEDFNMTEITKIVKVPQPMFLVTMSTDEVQMKKLLTNSNMVSQENGRFKLSPLFSGGQDIFLIQKDNLLLASNDANILDKSFSNSGDIYNLATSKPMSMYLNAETLVAAIPEDYKGANKPILDEIQKRIEAVENYIEPSNGKTLQAKFSIKFQDKDRNGLSQLKEMFDSIEKKRKNLVL